MFWRSGFLDCPWFLGCIMNEIFILSSLPNMPWAQRSPECEINRQDKLDSVFLRLWSKLGREQKTVHGQKTVTILHFVNGLRLYSTKNQKRFTENIKIQANFISGTTDKSDSTHLIGRYQYADSHLLIIRTTRNSFLSTIWFPSVSNILKAIRKPDLDSEKQGEKNHDI